MEGRANDDAGGRGNPRSRQPIVNFGHGRLEGFRRHCFAGLVERGRQVVDQFLINDVENGQVRFVSRGEAGRLGEGGFGSG